MDSQVLETIKTLYHSMTNEIREIETARLLGYNIIDYHQEFDLNMNMMSVIMDNFSMNWINQTVSDEEMEKFCEDIITTIKTTCNIDIEHDHAMITANNLACVSKPDSAPIAGVLTFLDILSEADKLQFDLTQEQKIHIAKTIVLLIYDNSNVLTTVYKHRKSTSEEYHEMIYRMYGMLKVNLSMFNGEIYSFPTYELLKFGIKTFMRHLESLYQKNNPSEYHRYI